MISTINPRTRDISNLTTENRLKSLRYIRLYQSIGILCIALGGTHAVVPPPQIVLPTGGVGVGPSQPTTVAPTERGDGIQEQVVSPSGGASRSKSPKDGDETESERGFEQNILFEQETLPNTPPSGAVPALGREEATPHIETTESTTPSTESGAPGSQSSGLMRLFLGDASILDNFEDILADLEVLKGFAKELGISEGFESLSLPIETLTGSTRGLGSRCAYTTPCKHNINRLGVSYSPFGL